MSHLNIDRLMARRGIDRQEALRILGDPGLVDQLILTGDIPAHISEAVAMPGIASTSISFGCDPTREVCPYIPPTNGLIMPGTVPAGIVAPNWQEWIRMAIDTWQNRPGESVPIAGPPPGPLVLGQGSGTPGLFPPGGLEGITNGGCVPCRKPKVQFIRLPNGLPGCPSGYHPEKSGKPYCVRNRRMNSLNPRALSRASRRVGGFARAVKRARTLKQVCRSL